ncbi:hypothetical protein KEM56_001145 [Ascosphaera pollenicola]|nr:hypothetical protein KEM56_001145 [Ascosphaera pollenicola]
MAATVRAVQKRADKLDNAFNVPKGGFTFRPGEYTTLTWNPSTHGTVTLKLQDFSDKDTVTPGDGFTLAESIPNGGSYKVQIPRGLESGTYAIEILDDQDSNNVNFTPKWVYIDLAQKAVEEDSSSESATATADATATASATATATETSAATSSESATESATSSSVSATASTDSSTTASATGTMTESSTASDDTASATTSGTLSSDMVSGSKIMTSTGLSSSTTDEPMTSSGLTTTEMHATAGNLTTTEKPTTMSGSMLSHTQILNATHSATHSHTTTLLSSSGHKHDMTASPTTMSSTSGTTTSTTVENTPSLPIESHSVPKDSGAMLLKTPSLLLAAALYFVFSL